MQFKIENKLTTSDIENLAYAIEDKLVGSIELLHEFEYESIGVSPLVISPRNGYSMTVSIDFYDPIGDRICSILGIKDQGFKKSARTIEMNIKRSIIDPSKLTQDINSSISFIEKTVNYACTVRSESIQDTLIIDFRQITHQLAKVKANGERKLRGEKIKAFELIHADRGTDLKALSDRLVPFYEEYDRWDLYSAKKVYRLLPRDFVSKLLKCQGNAMISEDEFSKREKEVLETLVKRHQIKRRRIAGKVYYFRLDDRTKRYLNKALRKRKF